MISKLQISAVGRVPPVEKHWFRKLTEAVNLNIACNKTKLAYLLTNQPSSKQLNSGTSPTKRFDVCPRLSALRCTAQHDARLRHRNVSCLNEITVAKREILAAVLKEIKFFRDMKLRLLHLPGLGTTQTINGEKAKHFQNK